MWNYSVKLNCLGFNQEVGHLQASLNVTTFYEKEEESTEYDGVYEQCLFSVKESKMNCRENNEQTTLFIYFYMPQISVPKQWIILDTSILSASKYVIFSVTT